MRELKLAIATLEGGVHRRVAPAAGSKLLWRGSWDISLHPQVTFLDTRSKRGSSADRRKKTAFTHSTRHFQISDRVAILIVAPSYFRTPEFGINASWPCRGVPHLGVSARSYAHNYPHYMVRILVTSVPLKLPLRSRAPAPKYPAMRRPSRNHIGTYSDTFE